MSFEIETFPNLPRHTQQVTLDGREYRLTLTWRDRTQSWYLNLSTLTGDDIAVGRRLSPRFAPLLGIPAAPPGELIVRGPSPYERFDLGDDLRLIYVEADEIEADEPDTSNVRITS